MRYEKPAVMDLNVRPVSGQIPLSCYSGTAPGSQGGYDVCSVGTGAYSHFWPACVAGPDPEALGDPGGYEVCVSGAAAAPWCDTGAGAAINMPDTCTAGPSDAP